MPLAIIWSKATSAISWIFGCSFRTRLTVKSSFSIFRVGPQGFGVTAGSLDLDRGATCGEGMHIAVDGPVPRVVDAGA
ncbi:hypothetical protein ACRYCC_24175 [Actinomadura scrupuli]|uniref:hypothetical protein n=1 Tax=Actinomadura scrupuli TaxID=559629 RepID=UPI003D9771AA